MFREYPTPFHIYDEAGIRTNVNRLQEAFAWNKGFREYFAVKALPNPVIMRLLFEMGCGMDCSSLTELMLARAVGVIGEDVMFSSNDTPAEEFRLAREMGVLVNLDDITLIPFLAENGGIPKTICCRLNPGGEFMLGNTIMGNPGEAKYGFTRSQLTEGFRQLIAAGATGIPACTRFWPATRRTTTITPRWRASSLKPPWNSVRRRARM